MIIGIRPNLPELIVHLDQALIIPPEDKKEEDKSVADIVTAVQYKEESHEKTRWTVKKKLKPSRIISWIQTGEETSILVHSSTKLVRKFWTRSQNFKKFGTDVWAALIWSHTASN